MKRLTTKKQKIVCSIETGEKLSVEHESVKSCNSDKLMEVICNYLIEKVISPKISVSN